MSHTLYDFTVQDSTNTPLALEKYKGQVVLVVNVASKCGFTPQYDGLQNLYEKLQAQGLVILGFPCNQFGSQEPGNNEEIQSFCRMNFGVSFPVMSKVDVNGKDTDPLFQWLKKEATGIFGTERIKWNFTKFLVGKDGQVIKRFSPRDTPEKIEESILKALKS